MASTIQVDNIKDIGGNTMISSNGSGTFTSNLPAVAPNVSTATGTLPIANGGTGAATFAAAGVVNAPAFEAYMSAPQTPTDATWTKLNYNTETFDTAGAYDTSLFRFTPLTSGKYFCYSQVTFDAQGVDIFHRAYSGIYFNGSIYKQSQFDNYDNYFLYATTNTISAVITFNGSSDYIESYCYFDVTSGTSHRINSGNSSIFGAYKLIGA